MGSSSRFHNVVTALLAGSFALVSMLTKFATAEYNCSTTSMELENSDFLTYFKTSCKDLETGVGKSAGHTMHVHTVSQKTNQTLYMWADCSLNQNQAFCMVCRSPCHLSFINHISYNNSLFQDCHQIFP